MPTLYIHKKLFTGKFENKYICLKIYELKLSLNIIMYDLLSYNSYLHIKIWCYSTCCKKGKECSY